MPRTGSGWPSLLWLHCTGRCRNSWQRNLWTSYPEAVRQPCSRPSCNYLFQHMIWRNSSCFCHPFLLLFWLSGNCFDRVHGITYRFREHRHPNSLVTYTGNTWWRVLQTKAEDHYHMPVLGSRVRLKGQCYEVLLVKPIDFFFDLVHQWRKFPSKWLGFGNLIMTYIRTSTRRDRREVSSIVTLKKKEKTFSDNKKSQFALASQNAFLLFFSGYFVPPPEI